MSFWNWLKPCAACAEKERLLLALETLHKDREAAWKETIIAYQADLTFLRKQNETLTTKLAEITEPGITRRTNPRPTPEPRPAPLVYPKVKEPDPLPGYSQ